MDLVVAFAANFLVTVVQDRGRDEVLVGALPVQVGLTGSICRRSECGSFFNHSRWRHRFWGWWWHSCFDIDAVVVDLDFVVTVALVTRFSLLRVLRVVAAVEASAGCTVIDFFLFVAAKHRVGSSA